MVWIRYFPKYMFIRKLSKNIDLGYKKSNILINKV